MQETVIEEIIKIIFGEYWLIPAIIIVVAGAVIRFIYRNHLPMYFKGCLIICMIAIAVLAGSDFVRWDQYPAIKQIREIISPLLLLLIVIAMVVLFCEYRKNDRQLKAVIKNTKPYGNKIKAWKELQKIKTANLTSWQKRKYDKRRLYLRVVLGNMCGAEQELKKFENDNGNKNC